VQVNYVGKAANLYQDAGYQLSGAAYVIEKHLGTSWLWDKVRGPWGRGLLLMGCLCACCCAEDRV
jgi:hypothetical protein